MRLVGLRRLNTVEGWSRDASKEVANEVIDRAYDADATLSDGAKRFIDRHLTPGEKRPAAPSVLGQDQATRKKAEGPDRLARRALRYVAMGVRTRGLDIKAGASKFKADQAAREEAEAGSTVGIGALPPAATCGGRDDPCCAARRHAVARCLLPRLRHEPSN
jgi:hypothetical protein